MRGLIAGLGMCLALLAPPARAAASDACLDAAASDAEAAACSGASIAALEADISKAYEGLKASLAKEDAQALAEDQAAFQRARAIVNSGEGFSVTDFLSNRLSFLTSVEAAPDGYVGVWRNEFGMAEVKPAVGGKYPVLVETLDPVGGRWLCRFEGLGQMRDGELRVAHQDDPQGRDWTLSLLRSGQRLLVDPVRGPASDGEVTFPYCGRSGRVDFDYFAARAPAPEPDRQP